MRRPTRAQALTRRTALAAAVVAVVALVLLVVARSGGSTEDPEAERLRSTSEAAPSTVGSTGQEMTSTTAPWSSTGAFAADLSGPGPVIGAGPLTTYRVEVEDGAHVATDDFARLVESIMSDPRGWAGAMGISLQRVTDVDADITISLATPDSVDRLCAPLQTDGEVSCAIYGRAIINVKRWQEGAEPSQLSLDDYRRYLVLHEVGHVLGLHHVECPGPGAPAPVMLQQTLGIGDCAPNPWPVPEDRTG